MASRRELGRLPSSSRVSTTASNWWTTARALPGLVAERLFCYKGDSARVCIGVRGPVVNLLAVLAEIKPQRHRVDTGDDVGSSTWKTP